VIIFFPAFAFHIIVEMTYIKRTIKINSRGGHSSFVKVQNLIF
jgi:hypothetical protein